MRFGRDSEGQEWLALSHCRWHRRKEDSSIRTCHSDRRWPGRSAPHETPRRGYSTVHDEDSTHSGKRTRHAANPDSWHNPGNPQGHAVWSAARLDIRSLSSDVIAFGWRVRKQVTLKLIELPRGARRHFFDVIVGIGL